MGCIVYSPHWLQTTMSLLSKWVNYILTSYVGLSALLVSTDRAMRRPTNRGTSDRLAPRFLYVLDISKHDIVSKGVGWRILTLCGDKSTNEC